MPDQFLALRLERKQFERAIWQIKVSPRWASHQHTPQVLRRHKSYSTCISLWTSAIAPGETLVKNYLNLYTRSSASIYRLRRKIEAGFSDLLAIQFQEGVNHGFGTETLFIVMLGFRSSGQSGCPQFLAK